MIYYRMKLYPDEFGLTISTQTFRTIHETPCMHFCVNEYDYNFLVSMNKTRRHEGETLRQTAKSFNHKIYQIHKTRSRIAFDTRQKAFDNLIYLKKLQLGHVERTQRYLTAFLKEIEESYDDVFKNIDKPIRSTHGLMNDLYVFE